MLSQSSSKCLQESGADCSEEMSGRHEHEYQDVKQECQKFQNLYQGPDRALKTVFLKNI